LHFFSCFLNAACGASVPLGATDFLVAGANSLLVYNATFGFVGALVYAPGGLFTGLDFTSSGNVLASTGAGSGWQEYTVNGVLVRNVTNAQYLAYAYDIKFGYDNVYVADFFNPVIAVFDEATGDFLATLNSTGRSCSGLAVLPDNLLWSWGPSQFALGVFDLSNNTYLGNVRFDNHQQQAYSMFYSASTNTVLMCDGLASAIYERSVPSGAFVRKFVYGTGVVCEDVTRGPNGNVYATMYTATASYVYQWSSTGKYLGFASLVPSASYGIIWAGNMKKK